MPAVAGCVSRAEAIPSSNGVPSPAQYTQMALPAAALVKLWVAKKVLVLVAARVRAGAGVAGCSSVRATDTLFAVQAYGVRRLYRCAARGHWHFLALVVADTLCVQAWS